MRTSPNPDDGKNAAGAAHGLRPARSRPRPQMQAALDGALLVVAVAATASLLLEHGFHHPPWWLSRVGLQVVQIVAAVLLLAERAARCALAEKWTIHLRGQWVDALLPVAAVAIAVLARDWAPIWLTAVRVYILATLLACGVRLYVAAAGSGIRPARLLVGSFLFCILIGTGLLLLPRAVPEGETPLSFPDALFTATSATCVTGLIVRDTGSEFAFLGQTVILCLIQIGGLGIMTFGTVFVLMGRRSLGLRQSAAVGEAIGEQPLGRITRMVKFIVLSTLLAEGIGALLLRPLWEGQAGGAFATVFHSVSAFCNAGFSLQHASFTEMRDSWQVMLVLPALIILGGIGFPVLMDVADGVPSALRYYLRRWRRPVAGVPRPRWTLHTKIVLTTSLLLLVFGTAGVLLVEPRAARARIGWAQHQTAERAAAAQTDWQRMGTGGRVRQAWFQAVTARTAGFNTIDMDELSAPSKLWVMALMVVGGSPASTAGGMKTATLAVLLMLVWSVLRRRGHVEAFGRRLPESLLGRAVTLAVLYAALVGITTLALALAQGHTARFLDVLFEAVSACGTVGLTLGETARLTLAGKLVIIGAMFIGRLGPLTLLMSLTAGRPVPRYRYPEESLVIG